jgi:hypothetical protein
MKLKTTYTPYNSSLLKFIGLSLLVNVAGALNQNIVPYLFIGYFAHNLYEQYQHNNKLIKTVELKLEGEKEARIVDMKPNFVDIFTVYNVSGLSAFIFDLANEFVTNKQPVLTKLEKISSLVWLVSKGIHLFSSDKAEYNFTDQKTGELMSAEDIIGSEFLDYIN